MKSKILFILLLAAFGCQKKDVEPNKEPGKIYSYVVEVKDNGAQVNGKIIVVQ